MSSSFVENWVYSDKVKDHFMNPRNLFSKEDENFEYNGVGEVGSLACGDQMRVIIKIEDDIIKDIRWLTYGCASAIASTSVMSEMVKGMTLAESYKLTPKKIMDELGGLPANKFHCSVLGDKALRAAIDNYFEEQGKPNPFKKGVAKRICSCCTATDVKVEELIKTEKVKTIEELKEQIGQGCPKCKTKVDDMFHELRHIYGFEL